LGEKMAKLTHFYSTNERSMKDVNLFFSEASIMPKTKEMVEPPFSGVGKLIAVAMTESDFKKATDGRMSEKWQSLPLEPSSTAKKYFD